MLSLPLGGVGGWAHFSMLNPLLIADPTDSCGAVGLTRTMNVVQLLGGSFGDGLGVRHL